MQKHTLTLSTAVISLLMFGCGSSGADGQFQGQPSIPVTIADVGTKDIVTTFETLGTLAPSTTVDVRPMVDGQILETFVVEGEEVIPGTPLFKIDPYPYEIALKEASAQLAVDKAAAAGIEKKIERYRGLAEKDIVAKTEWDDLITQKERAHAMIDLDQSRVDAAQLKLDRCLVKAPAEGRVGKIDVHPGQLVSSSQTTPLATIAKLNPLTIEFHVTEKEFAKIKNGVPEVEMSTLCSTSKARNAKVTFLDNAYDSANGMLLVRGKVANDSGCLRPGQTVKIRVPVDKKDGMLVVPQKSVRFNQKGAYVYVVNGDNTVSLRQVVLGSEEGHDQVVLEGLEPTDKIVMDGHLRLSDGSKVDIKS